MQIDLIMNEYSVNRLIAIILNIFSTSKTMRLAFLEINLVVLRTFVAES